jgi:hypothetical protein
MGDRYESKVDMLLGCGHFDDELFVLNRYSDREGRHWFEGGPGGLSIAGKSK